MAFWRMFAHFLDASCGMAMEDGSMENGYLSLKVSTNKHKLQRTRVLKRDQESCSRDSPFASKLQFCG